MFESTGGAVGVADLRSWVSALGSADVDRADQIDEIEWLERLKSACSARQARLAVAFEECERDRQVALGIPARRAGRGVAEQVALARRESPTQGGRHLGLAKALVNEMPNTLDALSRGDVSEWTATVVVRETACLASADRSLVDLELAGKLASLGPKRARREAWAAACRLDPHAAVARNAKAVQARCVSVRPAPEAMTYLTALLPVKDGVAAYAALDAAASSARAAGDDRSRGQVMADVLVDRLTGRDPADCDQTPVEVHLVMTDAALLGDSEQPAVLSADPGTGCTVSDLVPAQAARELVHDADRAWVRRLYVSPESGQLVAMESTRRVFDGLLRRALVLRDQTCRTPWCEAPIRHGDHIDPHVSGGPTTLDNGQGLCERCNQTKNLPGWHAERRPGTAHAVRTTTPTGATYDSTAPPLAALVS